MGFFISITPYGVSTYAESPPFLRNPLCHRQLNQYHIFETKSIDTHAEGVYNGDMTNANETNASQVETKEKTRNDLDNAS